MRLQNLIAAIMIVALVAQIVLASLVFADSNEKSLFA
jgi:hypothetical protein